jgi:hypothetical protein
MRLLPTGLRTLALALIVSASASASAKECKTVDANLISGLFVEGCTSPVGFCTRGMVASGPLAGSFEFTALTAEQPDLASPVMFYTGMVAYTTKKGTLRVRDSGMFDGNNGAFMEVQNVTRGTKNLKGFTGTLMSQGDGIFAVFGGMTQLIGFKGTVAGEICRARRHDGADAKDDELDDR